MARAKTAKKRAKKAPAAAKAGARKRTHPLIAKIAARGVVRPASLTSAEIAAVCGSALAQVED